MVLKIILRCSLRHDDLHSKLLSKYLLIDLVIRDFATRKVFPKPEIQLVFTRNYVVKSNAELKTNLNYNPSAERWSIHYRFSKPRFQKHAQPLMTV